MSEINKEVVSDWLKARNVIKEFIRELLRKNALGTADEKYLDHNAAALIARLAHENMTIDTVKETE